MDSKLLTEALHILLDPIAYRSTCFLCLAKKKTNSVNEVYEISDLHFRISASVSEMMRTLFPSYALVLEQACEDCEDLILKMYILMEKWNSKAKYLCHIVKVLENELFSKSASAVPNEIKIHIPKYDFKSNVHAVNEETQNSLSNDIFMCKKCMMQFESQETLDNHKKVICYKGNQTNAIVCDTCGKICKNPQTLKAHLNCHKEKQCPYCMKSLKTHSHYKLHIKSHEQVQKRKRKKLYYKCHDCNYKSLNKRTLEAHMNKIHLNIRPYICQVCSKGFFKKSNLTEHLHIHVKIRIDTCEICGESFSTKKCLNEHLRLHTKEKPYACEICGKTFVTSGRRSDHIKRQHMEKKECCNVCTKKYSLRKELNRHIKKIHGSNRIIAEESEIVEQVTIPHYAYDYSYIECDTENNDVLY